MRLIIAGSRDMTHSEVDINRLVSCLPQPVTAVISGMATGIDKCGVFWAHARGLKVYPFLPDWEKFGKSAGPVRNMAMAENADALLAIWDGSSRGTKDMIDKMKAKGKPVLIFIPGKE